MKVLVIGGATIDVITSIDPRDIESITMRNAANSYLMMEQGKKVEASRIDTQVGGGATNAAVAMARMGAEVGCVLKLGNDMDAERILKRLAEEGVNTSYVTMDPSEHTGKSVIISSHDRNAGVFVYRGANTKLRASDITESMFADVDLVYVSTLSSRSADVFPTIVKYAKKSGAFVACNPGIRQIRQRKEQLLNAFQWVDLIAVNEDEAAALAEGYVPILQADIATNTAAPELIREGLGENGAKVTLGALGRKLQKIGCQYLVVTNGAEGAYLCSDNIVYFCPATPCELSTTIGAGDAFNATISKFLASKQPVEIALRMAADNAASVASQLDTQSGLLLLDELEKRVLSVGKSDILSFPINDNM